MLLRRCPPAPGLGHGHWDRGSEEERRAERSEEPCALPRGGFVTAEAPGMLWAPDPAAEAVGAHSPLSPEPGTAECRSSRHRDGDHETSCLSPMLLDLACKELKKLYICVVSSAKGLNLLVFHPLHSLGITQHTVKDNICAEPCVCV